MGKNLGVRLIGFYIQALLRVVSYSSEMWLGLLPNMI